MKTHAKKSEKPKVRAALLPCLAAIVTVLSCTMGTQPTGFDKDAIVVQAYLFAGRPVGDVRLIHLRKAVRDTVVEIYNYDYVNNRIDTVDTTLTLVKDSTVDNAAVTISGGGQSCGLAFRESGTYRDTSGNLVIAAGRTYRIDVSADGRHAWAQTTVPSRVGGLTVSRETLYVVQAKPDTGRGKDTIYKVPPKVGKIGGKVDPLTTLLPDSLTNLMVRWNNPDHAYLYFRCVLDTNLPYRIQNGAYIAADSLKITSSGYWGYSGIFNKNDSVVLGFSQPGRYKLILYTTTPDYRLMVAEVADTTRQDEWIRSPTNVNNGLGVFTSFSYDSVFFNIVAKASGN